MKKKNYTMNFNLYLVNITCSFQPYIHSTCKNKRSGNENVMSYSPVGRRQAVYQHSLITRKDVGEVVPCLVQVSVAAYCLWRRFHLLSYSCVLSWCSSLLFLIVVKSKQSVLTNSPLICVQIRDKRFFFLRGRLLRGWHEEHANCLFCALDKTNTWKQIICSNCFKKSHIFYSKCRS